MRKILSIVVCCLLGICPIKTVWAQSQPGIINTIYGIGVAGLSGDGGPASNAQIDTPCASVLDNAGNLILATFRNVRKISPSGIITTIAGTSGYGYSGDGGPATDANFFFINGVAVDNSGNVYINDQNNFRIRKVNTSGTITTIAGTGISGYTGDGGPASNAAINNLTGLGEIIIDTANNIYFIDQSSVVRKINTAGIINTIAGGGTDTANGTPATNAQISVGGIAIDRAGNIYVSDWYRNKIRRINSSGIINDFAGTGIAGFSGDGGPAANAFLNEPYYLSCDSFDNIYFTDMGNSRIRMINSLGIITTIAGNGTWGSTGDGGLATSAEISGYYVGVNTNHNVLAAGPATLREIGSLLPSRISLSDSFSVYVDSFCTGLNLTVLSNHYSTLNSTKICYGDGLFDSSGFPINYFGNGITQFSHNYGSSGTFTLKCIFYTNSIALDSTTFQYRNYFCQTFPILFYRDMNSDYQYDNGDGLNFTPISIEVDSNNIAIDTVSAASGIYYNAIGNLGDVYTFRVLSNTDNWMISSTCISGTSVTDTITASEVNTHTKYVPLSCSMVENFDFAAYNDVIMPGDIVLSGNIYVSNIYSSCAYTFPATVMLYHNNKYKYLPGFVNPPPNSYTDSSLTWNFSAISSDAVVPTRIQYQLFDTVGGLTFGDTIQTAAVITPLAGDVDTNNNRCNVISPVNSGMDPNVMLVNPQGNIPSDTTLQYTINFQNTGTDTAFNVYVMDTLSDFVNPKTLQLQFVSAAMNISYQTYAGHNIVKFDFPNIDLLDTSMSKALCNGAIIFKINTYPWIPVGTTIFNHAGIFFDYNPVVMTDTVEDIVTSVNYNKVAQVSVPSPVSIFPNPTHDAITIKADAGVYGSYSVSNAIGTVVLQGSITSLQTQVSMTALPDGVYFVTVVPQHTPNPSQEGNIIVQQVVKY